MAKKKKVSLVTLILLAVAAVGLILAIVGICIDYFKFSAEVLGHQGEAQKFALFSDNLSGESDIPVACVQAFAILSVIAAAVCTAVAVLNALGIVKLKFLVKLIVCAVAVVFAILALSLGFAYAGQASMTAGNLASTTGTLAAGGWLLPIGTIMSAVPALLVK